MKLCCKFSTNEMFSLCCLRQKQVKFDTVPYVQYGTYILYGTLKIYMHESDCVMVQILLVSQV